MNLPSLALSRLRGSKVAAATSIMLVAFFAILLTAAVAWAGVFIEGTNGPDRLVGTNTADTLRAKGGNDVVIGKGGIDELSGNAGNDTVYGGDGADLIDGGSDNDLLVGGNGADTIQAAAGNDTIYTGTRQDAGLPKNRDEVRCGSGQDTVFVGPGDVASHNIEAKDACEVIIHYN
jgi:Ca2+-binding RTX toxin-like protein